MSRSTQRGRRLGTGLAGALALLAGLTLSPAATSQSVRIEIEVRNTPTPTDDYLTWAPTPARIRLVPGQVPLPDRLVVLTNDPAGSIPEGSRTPLDGDFLFAETVQPGQTATQETLKLILPGNGAWRGFVMAGKFGRPSTRDKDALVDVHLDSASGPVVHAHPAMVRIRKDARTLTPGERDRLLKAIANLHAKGAYMPYIVVHDEAGKGKRTPSDYWPDQAHAMAGFLPWHRAYLLQFEREIQKDFPDVALPYWRLSEPSNVFTPEFLGSNPQEGSDRIVRPEFSSGHPLAFWQIQDEPLMRFAKIRTDISQFSSESESLSPAQNPDIYANFRARVERNPHNNGHNWVGPWMQNCRISPKDPIFWVFHSEFDRLWAKWQRKYARFGTAGVEPKDYAPTGVYDPNAAGCSDPGPSGCVPLGHSLKDTMWPWDGTAGPGVNAGANRPPARHGRFPASSVLGLWPASPASPQPSDMIDYAGFNAGRPDMGFAYDDVAFGLGSPAERMAKALQAPAAVDAAPLGRVLADKEQPDDIRALALRRLADVDEAATVDRALRILGDSQDGGEQLDAEAVQLLNIQMMFTDEGTARHGEIHAALRAALTDSRPLVRVAAMSSLASHRDPEAIRLLVESLTRPENALFAPADAIRTLTVSGLAENVAVVRPYLDSPDPDTRVAAVTALLADPASQPRIVRMIGDAAETFEVREAAIEALARGVPGAAQAVVALLADPAADPRLRARASAAADFRLNAAGLGEEERSILKNKKEIQK